jgi:hypothetical protein
MTGKIPLNLLQYHPFTRKYLEILANTIEIHGYTNEIYGIILKHIQMYCNVIKIHIDTIETPLKLYRNTIDTLK